VDFAIATRINETRNLAIIWTSDVLISVGGSCGTLSEMGSALKMAKRVIGLRTRDIKCVVTAETPNEALRLTQGD